MIGQPESSDSVDLALSRNSSSVRSAKVGYGEEQSHGPSWVGDLTYPSSDVEHGRRIFVSFDWTGEACTGALGARLSS